MVKHLFWCFFPPGLHTLRWVANILACLQFSPYSLRWHPSTKDRGFANSCGLFHVSAGHCTSKREEGSLCRLQSPRFMSLSASVVANLLASQRLSQSASTIFAKCLKKIRAVYAMGSKIRAVYATGSSIKRRRKLKCCGGTEKLLCLA